MTQPTSPWVRARGQLMFLLGLVVASAIILKIESAEFVPVSEVAPRPALLQPSTDDIAPAWYRIAWDESAAATTEALGLRIKATLAAHRLNLIDGREVHRRVSVRIAIGSGRAPAITEAPAYVSALELVAWGYPSLRNLATAELIRWSALPDDQLMRTALIHAGDSQ
jgi:hypothetical protein